MARRVSLYLLALLFVAAGVLHFARPEPYERIMPPYLDWPRALVYASGFFEIAGGIGLLISRVRRAAAAGLILLLLAVWPANVQMLLNARATGASLWWEGLLWARLPLQVLLMGWLWWTAKPGRTGAARSG